MKKLLVVLGIVIGLLVSADARDLYSTGVSVPSGYTKIESRGNGFAVYKKGWLYVTVVDLQKYDVTFRGYRKASSKNSFYKYKLNDWWRAYNWKTLAMFNGQFFNENINPTPLSFPLRSQWRTVVTQVDPGRSLKTLKIYSNGKEAQIYDGYNSYYLRNSKELIVGLDPSENMKSWAPIGRFYIGGLYEQSSSIRYLLFFTAIAKTQDSMMDEIYDWGVSDQDIVMMDGSGSAQMKTKKVTIYGNAGTSPDRRPLANVLLVREKGFLPAF